MNDRMRPPAASTAFARPKFVRTSLASRLPRDPPKSDEVAPPPNCVCDEDCVCDLIGEGAALVGDRPDVACSVTVSPANRRAATVSTRTNAIWFWTCPSSTSVSLVVVWNGTVKDTPDRDVLAADRSNGVENLLLGRRRERVELNQVDDAARCLSGASKLHGRRRDGLCGTAGPWRGCRSRSCVRRDRRDQGLRSARTVSGIQIVTGHRLRSHRDQEIRDTTGQDQRVTVRSTLDLD